MNCPKLIILGFALVSGAAIVSSAQASDRPLVSSLESKAICTGVQKYLKVMSPTVDDTQACLNGTFARAYNGAPADLQNIVFIGAPNEQSPFSVCVGYLTSMHGKLNFEAEECHELGPRQGI